jgi:hypothetical protein
MVIGRAGAASQRPPAVSELRQILRHRIGQREPALFEELHDRHRRDVLVIE